MKAKDDDMELIQGPTSSSTSATESKLLKAQMAAGIINTLNERGRSVRAGAKMAQPSDIQRIRNADLSRFTIDRLVRIAYRLGHKPEMKMTNVRADGGVSADRAHLRHTRRLSFHMQMGCCRGHAAD